MAINPVKLLTAASATATQGSPTVAITGNVDCSRVYQGTVVYIGENHPVEALSGTSPDTNGNSTITLRDAWSGSTVTTKLTAFNTIEGLVGAIEKANQVVQETSGIEALGGVGFIERTGENAYSTRAVTTKGKELISQGTESDMRGTLGLGTSAPLDTTTGVRDNTTGSILKVGDFGLGGAGADVSGVSLNTVEDSGFYSYTSTTTQTPRVGSGQVLVSRLTPTDTVQLAFGINPDGMFRRVQSSGVWSDWKEMWDEANLASSVTYRGQLDISGGDTSLPSSPQNGDLYVVAVAGTITVSTAGAAETSTGVNVGEQIIYNGTTETWDLIAQVTSADSINYDNTSSGLTATDVQAAIDENTSGISSLGTSKAPKASPSFTGTMQTSGAVSFTSGGAERLNIAPSFSPVTSYKFDASNFFLEFESVGTSNAGIVFNTGVSSASEAMRIDADGNVGIGTTSPSSGLEVSGTSTKAWATLNRTDTGTNIVDFRESGSRLGYVGFIGYDLTFLQSDPTAPTIFLNASGEAMRIASNGNVGIGTVSPNAALDVVNNSNTVASITQQATSISSNSYTFEVDSSSHSSNLSTAGAFKIDVNSGRAFTVNGLGNVGIGTSSPNALLDISTSNSIARVITASTSASGYAGYRLANGSGYWEMQIDGANQGLRFIEDDVERVRINSSGNVGIGTSSPDRRFTVQGGSGDNAPVRVIGGAGTSDCYISLVDDNTTSSFNVRVGSRGDDLSFWAGGLERTRIDSSGNVLVGKTTGALNTAGHVMTGAGTASHTASNSTALTINRLDSSGTSVIFAQAGGTVGSISVTGSTTSYNTSSDYRLKTDLQPVLNASDRVQQLNPINFEWVADGTRVDGFVAHELAEVIPEAVTGEKDAVKDEEYEVTPAELDEEGNVVTEAVMGTREVPDYQGIDQSKLVPLLTAALQEALTKIESLEQRVTDLENT